MKESILLKHADLFDSLRGELKPDIDVFIDGGVIKETGKIEKTDSADIKQIDCSGKYLLPGLFECHAHLAILTNQDNEVREKILQECSIDGEDTGDGLEEQVLKAFVKQGITQIRDVGGPVETLRSIKEDISRGDYPGPGIFYSGPMLEKSPLTGEGNNKRWPGFTVAVDTRQDAEDIVRMLSDKGANFVKTFSKFDREVIKYLIEAAGKINLPVTHDPGPTFFHSISMDTGIELGIKCFEHGKSPWCVALKDDLKAEHERLKNAEPEMKQVFIDKMLSIGKNSIDVGKISLLAEKMKANDVYFCPTLHVFKDYVERPEVYREEDPDKYREIFKVLFEVSRFITGEIVNHGVEILVGQDGWNPVFTLNEMILLSETGLSRSEIIKGATIYPAQWLGVDDYLGSISPGKRANILILDKNPLEDIRNIGNIHTVLINGQIVFQN